MSTGEPSEEKTGGRCAEHQPPAHDYFRLPGLLFPRPLPDELFVLLGALLGVGLLLLGDFLLMVFSRVDALSG